MLKITDLNKFIDRVINILSNNLAYEINFYKYVGIETDEFKEVKLLTNVIRITNPYTNEYFFIEISKKFTTLFKFDKEDDLYKEFDVILHPFLYDFEEYVFELSRILFSNIPWLR